MRNFILGFPACSSSYRCWVNIGMSRMTSRITPERSQHPASVKIFLAGISYLPPQSPIKSQWSSHPTRRAPWRRLGTLGLRPSWTRSRPAAGLVRGRYSVILGRSEAFRKPLKSANPHPQHAQIAMNTLASLSLLLQEPLCAFLHHDHYAGQLWRTFSWTADRFDLFLESLENPRLQSTTLIWQLQWILRLGRGCWGLFSYLCC